MSDSYGATLTGQALLATLPETVPVSALSGDDPSRALWPVYEFRPLDRDVRGTVLRYADGLWLADDGEYDIAFIAYGMGAPFALGVDLPHQKNIIWSGLTTHWSGNVADHPRGGNPWHYMLREGAADWGGDWGRNSHPNVRAYEAAMSKCASINGCANGRGPRFKAGDAYIEIGLLRERETKCVVCPPEALCCMYCGDGWATTLLAQAIETRSAVTAGHSPEGESEVAKPCAQGEPA